ncbi:MAG: sigma-70 family RNA polymerase sigma factor [Planctomycetota bacterium]
MTDDKHSERADADDEALANAAAAGDRSALDALLCRSLPELRDLVARRAGALVRGRETDSDIVQSVCREILSHGATFRYPSENAFRRWLYKTAIRKLGQRREKWTAVKRDVLREQPLPDDEESNLDPAVHVEMTGSARMAVREELDRLERALQMLRPDYREVIVLSRIGGHSREEIANQLGRSPSSVRMLLHRAMAQLAVELERTSPDRRE